MSIKVLKVIMTTVINVIIEDFVILFYINRAKLLEQNENERNVLAAPLVGVKNMLR